MLHQCLRFTRNLESLPLLFKVICLIGLSCQLFDIFNEYFQFKVNFRAIVFIPEEVEELSMGICLPIEFAIDYNKFNSNFRYNWTPKEFFQNGMLQNLSIHQIYNYTYDADKIVYAVSYNNKYWNVRWSKTSLSSIMKIQKYYFAKKLCYLYSVRSFKPINVDQLRGSSVGTVDFSNQLSETSQVWLFIAEKDKIPVRETIKGRFIFRGNSSIKLDMFQSSHYIIRKELMQAPYETSCFSFSNLNFTSSIECLERCVVLKCFQKWGAISSDSLLKDKIKDYKFVRILNYTKYLAELNEIREFCQSSCPNTTCEDTQVFTIQESGAYVGLESLTEKNVSIEWQRLTPSIPSITISCRPTTTWPQLMLYIMSSVSTWTGLSMMSFNPILLFPILSRIKSTSRILPLQHRQRREITEMSHTDRMSRFENRLLLQSLAIERLRQILFHLLNDRRVIFR